MLWAALDGGINSAFEALPCVGMAILLRFSRRAFRSSRHMIGPQPLSKICPLASVLFDPGALLERPALAVFPMTVIARWADIDKSLAELLLLMLKSPNLSVGMAMFQALNSGEAKRAALLAAAAEALEQNVDDHNLFRAVLNAISASRNRRNHFAHHLWGVARELPDALLLADPKDWVKQSTAVEAYEQGLTDADTSVFFETMLKPQPTLFVDRRKVRVFSKLALAADADAANLARDHVILLRFALDRRRFGGEQADRTRATLLSAPQVRQEFRRLTIESMESVRLRRRLHKSREKQLRARNARKKPERA